MSTRDDKGWCGLWEDTSEGEKNLNIVQEIHFLVLFVSHGSFLSLTVETSLYGEGQLGNGEDKFTYNNKMVF